MAKHIWHDRDGTVVEMNDVQAQLDASLVPTYEGLAGDFTLGQDVKDSIHAPTVAVIVNALPKLPPRRAAHWIRELEQLGIKLPKHKAPVPPAPPIPPTSSFTLPGSNH